MTWHQDIWTIFLNGRTIHLFFTFINPSMLYRDKSCVSSAIYHFEDKILGLLDVDGHEDEIVDNDDIIKTFKDSLKRFLNAVTLSRD